jgi:Protein of unknown function (DUF2934)
MATTRGRRTAEEPPNHADNVRNAPQATDWRRMTDAEHDNIARRAYELYEQRGREPGHELEDWLQAEHEVQQRRSAE